MIASTSLDLREPLLLLVTSVTPSRGLRLHATEHGLRVSVADETAIVPWSELRDGRFVQGLRRGVGPGTARHGGGRAPAALPEHPTVWAFAIAEDRGHGVVRVGIERGPIPALDDVGGRLAVARPASIPTMVVAVDIASSSAAALADRIDEVVVRVP